MKQRIVLRWAATGIFVLILAPIAVLNVEKLAEKNKWDQFLVNVWPVMSEWLGWANSPWVWVLAGVFGGATAALWINEWLARPQTESLPEASPGTSDEQKKELASFFRAKAEPPLQAAHNILGTIIRSLQETGDVKRHLAILIDRFVRDSDRAALSGVVNAINTGDNLQEAIGNMYEKYQWLTTWIHQGGEHADFSFNTDKNYARWKKLDEEFLRSLREIIARDGFEILRSKVKAVGWGEAFR